MTPLKRYLTLLSKQEKPIRRKSKTTYRLTWGNNNENVYNDLGEVIVFLESNHIMEGFTVIQEDGNDLTYIVQSILIKR